MVVAISRSIDCSPCFGKGPGSTCATDAPAIVSSDSARDNFFSETRSHQLRSEVSRSIVESVESVEPSATVPFDRNTARNTIALKSEARPARPNAIACPDGSPGSRVIGQTIDPMAAPTIVGITSERRFVFDFGLSPMLSGVDSKSGGS